MHNCIVLVDLVYIVFIECFCRPVCVCVCVCVISVNWTGTVFMLAG